MIVVKMLKRPPSMFWLCAAAIARVFSAQSGSSVTSLKSTTGTLSSSVTEAVQTHTISVGKVGLQSMARHHISMNLQKQVFLTNARRIIDILQTSYKQRLAMLLVSHFQVEVYTVQAYQLDVHRIPVLSSQPFCCSRRVWLSMYSI